MAATGRGDRPLARQFGRPVHRERPRLVGLGAAARRQAVEDVVGGIVNEHRILSGSLGGDRSHGRGVDQFRPIRLALGPIDGGVGRRVDDSRGPLASEQGHDLLGPLEIRHRAVAGHDLAQRRQDPHQLTAHLAGRPQEHDLHGDTSGGGSGRR